jgi:hypothetical protein
MTIWGAPSARGGAAVLFTLATVVVGADAFLLHELTASAASRVVAIAQERQARWTLDFMVHLQWFTCWRALFRG